MKHLKLFVTILTALFSLFPVLLQAQVDTAWVRRYNGTANNVDFAVAMGLDSAGNIYVTGTTNSSGSGNDYATIKYNSLGSELWVRKYNGLSNGPDQARAIAVASSGFLSITGTSAGSGTGYDIATVKYTTWGDTLWTRRYNSPQNTDDVASAITCDASGNIYVTGYGEVIINNDYVTIKYNSAGDVVWVRIYNGPGDYIDEASAITVDNQGYVYVTGTSHHYNSGRDYTTIKYDSSGTICWIADYNGIGNGVDNAQAIKLDTAGNVYVTGYSDGTNLHMDYATVKYNSAGVQEWAARYNGPANNIDAARSLAIDRQGNVYVTGNSTGTNYDLTTIKYNSAGVEQWVQRYDYNTEDASAIALDNQNNVYVAGKSGYYPNYDCVIIKYNSAGAQQWVQRYNGPGNNDDCASAIALDGMSNVYVAGYSYSSSTNYDYVTIKYVQGQGVEEGTTLDATRTTLEIYPNPAKTFFTICCSHVGATGVATLRDTLYAQSRQSGLGNPAHSILKMYDISGKSVKHWLINRRKREVYKINLSTKNSPPGVYFLSLETGGEKIIERMVIVK